MDNTFASKGSRSGATCTIVLQYGWWLTAANVGDSRAIVQCGETCTQLTDEHRLQANPSEV